MSLFRTLDRTCAPVSTAAQRPFLSFLYPPIQPYQSRRALHRTSTNLLPKVAHPASWPTDSFIRALAKAASCAKHAKQMSTLCAVIPSALKQHKPPRKSLLPPERRSFWSTRSTRGPFRKIRQFAQKELKALVDYYGIQLEKEGDLVERPSRPSWRVGDVHTAWQLPEPELKYRHWVDRLETLLEDDDPPNDDLYRCYSELPSPGVAYLEEKTIRRLLHQLSIVERVDQTAMQRFLAILDDMKHAGVHIIRSEWTTAIHFAGRFMGKVSADEVDSALHIWTEMEQTAGNKGGSVTFNVLFDIAVKAGKYTLAESFLKAMEARNLKLHRHFRVSLMYYYGVKQDGNGVRQTYHDLVQAGDVVDTAVMNAVIAALIRAGEPAAAEHVFERMKRLHAAKLNPLQPPRNWRESRKVGIRLTYGGQKLKEFDYTTELQQLQELTPIAPNSRTYGLLIRHHARTVGNIDRVAELLNEMKMNGVPSDGTIFIVIMHGFNSFGGMRYSSWTSDKLERLWEEYLRFVQAGAERTFFSSMAVISALKAFKKCTDSQRTLKAWEEARKVWEPQPQELDQILRALKKLVPSGQDKESGFSSPTGR